MYNLIVWFTCIAGQPLYRFPLFVVYLQIAMVVGICQILFDGFTHELSKINRDSIAYHLLDIRLVSLKLKIARKSLNVAPFPC